MKINYLDLFSGVGGFTLGLLNAGFKFDYHGFSEIDKYSIQTYKRRFKNGKELGSITDINENDLPKLDLVTFGFPCQDLSQAGKRKGLKGSRSGLFFEAIRIIRAKKPKYIIFENVKGLLSSGGGQDFKICLEEIADIGYDGQWELLNTRWFIPQNRERVYFVGHLRENRRPKIFPLIETGGVTDNRETKEQIASTLQSPGHACGNYKGMNMIKTSGLKQIGVIDKDSEATRVYDPSGNARTIKDGGGMGAKTGLYDVKGVAYRTRKYRGQEATIEERDDDVANAINSAQKDSMVKYKQKKIEIVGNLKGDGGHECHNVHDPGGIAPCVRENHGKITMVAEPSIRRLTPTECERLQGFPDGWTEGNSDTQRYKQMGNAVSVPVVQAIAEKLLLYI